MCRRRRFRFEFRFLLFFDKNQNFDEAVEQIMHKIYIYQVDYSFEVSLCKIYVVLQIPEG